MNTPDQLRLGRIAYEARMAFTGQYVIPWEELSERDTTLWVRVARTVEDAVRDTFFDMTRTHPETRYLGN